MKSRRGDTPRLYPTRNSLPRASLEPPCAKRPTSPLWPSRETPDCGRGCGDLVPSRKIPLPQQISFPLPPRDSSREGTHAHPFLLAFPGMGVWTNSKEQCAFASLCTSQGEAKRPVCIQVSGSTESSRGSPVICVTWVCVRSRACACARLYPCPRRNAGQKAGRGRCQAWGGGAWASVGREPGLGPPREPAPWSLGPCNGTCSPLRVKKLETLFAQQSAPRSRQSV